jgi:hypothetical protein
MARVRELPTWLRSLRVETRGWSIDVLSGWASERARGLIVRRLPRAGNGPGERSETRVRSWMEFGEHAWEPGFIDLWPLRWRQELQHTGADGSVSRSVSARDGDSYWWDHADGVKVTDARRLRAGLASAWVVGRRWASGPATREVVDRSTSVLGRSCIRVRVTPEPGRRLEAGRLYSGDSHDLIVDTATGMTFAVTSVVDGHPIPLRRGHRLRDRFTGCWRAYRGSVRGRTRSPVPALRFGRGSSRGDHCRCSHPDGYPPPPSTRSRAAACISAMRNQKQCSSSLAIDASS